MELHEARPSLVEHDIVAKAPDALDDALGVVDRAVIGALFDYRGAEGTFAFPRLFVGHQGVVANALAYRRLVQIFRANGANESVGVAVGRQINRNAATRHQRALVRRLMVVAVEQHQIALSNEIGAYNFIRRRGAVEHEIGLLGAEDRRRLFLRLKRRPLVGQKIAELEDRIVEVVAKDRFAQMLDKDASDRAAAVEDAAVEAWGSHQLVAFLLVVDERAEERRLQRVGVLLEARDQVSGDEFGRLFGQEHIAVDEVEHFDRNILKALAPNEDDDRHVEAAFAHEVDERRSLPL